MSPAEFTARFRGHCEHYHPEFLEKLTPAQLDHLAAANQPRAKTLDNTVDSSRFFILDDDEIEYEQTKAVRKAIAGGEPNGYAHLQQPCQFACRYLDGMVLPRSWPPEPLLFQTPIKKPEPVVVPAKNFEFVPLPIAEHKEMA